MKKTSVLPAGMTLTGDIDGDEDLVVLGRVEGAIHLDAALVIESGGAVRGDVRARTVTVRGILVGDAHAEETVWVEDGARLVGDILGPRVKVMDGARFRGHVRVLSPERQGPVTAPPQPMARDHRAPLAEPALPPQVARPAEAVPARMPHRAPEGRARATPTSAPEGRARPTDRKTPPVPSMPALTRIRARRRLAAAGD